MKWPCKRNETTPTEAPPIDGEEAERNVKTGLMVGHTKNRNGADNKEWYFKYAAYDAEYDEYVRHYDTNNDRLLEEYELNLQAAKISELTYATRDEGRGMRGAAEELAEADCTEAISMHMNSYNGVASGCEFWYLDGCIESKRFAEKLRAAYTKEFPHLTDRGLKKGHKRSRAYSALRAMEKEGFRKLCLAEWYFIDVKSDFVDPERIGAFLKKFGKQ
jgi:hypothetical protein